MSNLRRRQSPNEHIVMVSQVRGVCPKCERSLMYEKVGSRHKGYDVAHIYPLNPTPEEQELLKNEERLSSDVNDLANLIPLCNRCHREFDRPRTVEEYRLLVNLKKAILASERDHQLRQRYALQEELRSVVEHLVKHVPSSADGNDLAYDAKRVGEKVGGSVSGLFQRKIELEVQDYFPLIRQLFKGMDAEQVGLSVLVAQQVRTFFTAQQLIENDKTRIYKSVSTWIRQRVPGCSEEASDVLTSFFVQNCEVFD